MIQEIYTKEKGRYRFRKIAESSDPFEAQREAERLFPGIQTKVVESEQIHFDAKEAKERTKDDALVYIPLLIGAIVFFPVAIILLMAYLALNIFSGMSPPARKY